MLLHVRRCASRHPHQLKTAAADVAHPTDVRTSGIWSRPRGSIPSALNTCWKVWPWILVWAYVIWNFAPIFGQQISILDPSPLTLDFLVRLGPNFHPMGEKWGGLIGQKREYLIRASSQQRWEARLKNGQRSTAYYRYHSLRASDSRV